jgi:hypothetical protein
MKTLQTLFGYAVVSIFIIDFLLGVPKAMGCLYFDKTYDAGAFKEVDREALLFHDGEAANMILKTSFSGKMPKTLAWVIPLPAKPLSYKVTSGSLFQVLNQVFLPPPQDLGSRQGRGVLGKGAAVPPAGILVHETSIVGDYEIIPIEMLSATGGEDLNRWLEKQSFIASPLAIQKPYLKKGAFFLAIRSRFNAEELPTLAPLWIRYPAKDVTFPVRFTHDYRSFDLRVYMLTAPGARFSALKGSGWEPKDLKSGGQIKEESIDRQGTDYDKFDQLMNHLSEMRDIPSVVKFLDRKDLKLTRVTVTGINQSKIAKILRTQYLKSDIGIKAP